MNKGVQNSFSKAMQVSDLHFVGCALYPVNIYLLKISNRNTRKRWVQICSKLTKETPQLLQDCT